MEFNIVNCVWCQCRPEFVSVPRLQNGLQEKVSTLLLLLELLGKDFLMQRVQIYAIFSDLVSCN